ncbi:MAG TPA: tetratricopeptide repeat protein [Terriglobia bacterium]|nr:tetratricopeptide repeat protein [Terriglobia bacterium]
MAFDKAKTLQEANRYITQGKIAKAIKQYQLAFENEPSDLTLLNVVGDLYARENNVPEALKCFYTLADAYTREGYKLKAISIYKKIVRLDRDSVDPLLRLAELSSAQGLAREARECFKSALDAFERKGQHVQSLEILRKLCRLDPRNHSLRLQLAQAAERAGEGREAVEAYLGAAVLARDNGDIAASRTGLERAAELAPESAEVHLLRARQALADKKPKEVGEILGSVPEIQSSPEAKRLLLESCLAANNLDAASGLLPDVLESNPSNFAPAADFTARCIEKGEYESAFQVLKRAAPTLIARRETGPLMETLLRIWRSCPECIQILELVYEVAEKTSDAAAIPEVLKALEDACVQSDQLEKAEQAYARLAALEPENQTFKDLLQRVLGRHVRELTPSGQTPLAGANPPLERDATSSRFGGDKGTPPQPGRAGTPAGSLPPIQEGPVAQPVEFDLSQTGGAEDARAHGPEVPPPKEISLDFRSPQRDESSTGGPQIFRPESSAKKAPQQNCAEQSEVSKPSFNYEESREEVEFYLRHGFYQEAQKAVEELEKKCPAESQISELRRRVDQASRESKPTDVLKSAPPTGEQGGEKAEWDLPTRFLDSASAANPIRGNQAPAASAAEDGKVELIANMARERDSTLHGLCDPARSAASSASQDSRDSGSSAPDDAAAELRSLLDEFGGKSESADKPADDEQTHYNLGVAFREMGLLDEAIGEFQKVVNRTGSKLFGPHFLQGCTLLASCFMDKQMPAIAAKWYARALDAPGLDYEGALAVYYDLGMAFEKAGDTTAALEKFTEVYSQNIDYRDVAEKIRLLRQTSR